MTVDDAMQRVRDLSDARNDHEAHSMEDDLRGDVLRAIAAGHADPRGLADAALKTSELIFKRWYS